MDKSNTTCYITGVHTIAAIRGMEEYETLKEGFAPVVREINHLISNPFVEVNGCPVELKLYFSGDYKVVLFQKYVVHY